MSLSTNLRDRGHFEMARQAEDLERETRELKLQVDGLRRAAETEAQKYKQLRETHDSMRNHVQSIQRQVEDLYTASRDISYP